MPFTLATILLSGFVLLGAAAAPVIVQAQSIEEELKAIAEELLESETPSSGEVDATDEPAWGGGDGSLEDALRSVPMDLDLPFETYAKNAPLPAGPDKIATNLLQLVDGHRTKGAFDLAEQAEGLGIPYADGQAGVRLFAESKAEAEALRDRIEAQGGEVTAVFDNVVYARLPLNSVKSLGRVDELYFMDPEPTYRPLAPNPGGGFGERVSEGVELSQVQRLHRAGITGKRVKVGILDFGFERYSALVEAGELPKAQAARAFNQAQRLEVNGVHGTACAEIIADMAPHAELYLAVVDGQEGQIVQAAQWLAEQDVDIINFSGGGHYGPHNGSALLDRLVAHMVNNRDLLWVNAAGNEGASHWTQLAEDRNDNGAIDNISGHPDVIALKFSGQPFMVMVVWDDWGSDPGRPASSQDIDAYLLERNAAGEFRLVGESRQVQNGRGVPVEAIGSRRGVPAGTVLYLALHLKRVERPVRTHVFVMGGVQLFPVVSGHSVGIPATSDAALSVGAVDVRKDRLEAFSSQGPTDDRRQKPEISAPDNTTSLAYARNGSPGRFLGTSAAAPHVAGFAALLKQMEPQRSASELRRVMLQHVTPKGNGTPNHQYGHGRIDASKIEITDDTQEEDGDGEIDLERILQEILRGQQ